MPFLQAVMLLYGLFNIVVGVEAYVSKHSLPSLISASAIGIIVIGCAALSKTKPRIAYITATVMALLVAGRFAVKALQGQVWPAIILVSVSLLFALLLVGAHFAAMARRKREPSQTAE